MTRWVVRTLNKKKPITVEADSWDHDKDGWIGFFKEGASRPFVWFNHLDVLQITALDEPEPAPVVGDGKHTYVLPTTDTGLEPPETLPVFDTNYRVEPPT